MCWQQRTLLILRSQPTHTHQQDLLVLLLAPGTLEVLRYQPDQGRFDTVCQAVLSAGESWRLRSLCLGWLISLQKTATAQSQATCLTPFLNPPHCCNLRQHPTPPTWAAGWQ